ncbi:MAG TPA: hypothetical protein VG965_07340 [Patescibacteria group bacterium]|nr:hypothetical protein [Patescibacteria group bacterium]
MDQNADFAARREALLEEFTKIMAEALKSGHISPEESREASRFIVLNFNDTKDKYELKVWTEELALRYPIFKQALVSFEENDAEEADQQQIAATEEKLNELIHQTQN